VEAEKKEKEKRKGRGSHAGIATRPIIKKMIHSSAEEGRDKKKKRGERRRGGKDTVHRYFNSRGPRSSPKRARSPMYTERTIQDRHER